MQVSPLHTVYWEVSGSLSGAPVLVLHGGPGGGSQTDYRRYFDPTAYKIIQMDQRGCGKSTPHAELEDNNTQALVGDIEMLRDYLGVDTWYVFGGSWGSTLSLTQADIWDSNPRKLRSKKCFSKRHFSKGRDSCPRKDWSKETLVQGDIKSKDILVM